MNKKILITCLLVSVMLLVPINSAYSNIGIKLDNKPINPSNRGITLYVGGMGPNNYTKIQYAIDNSSDNDTVFVYSGIYFENVIIDKKISLIGENRDTTIIDANYTKSAVAFRTSRGKVSGFTMQHSGNESLDDAGVRFGKSGKYYKYHIIVGNKMVDNLYGIFGWDQGGYDVDGHIISDNIIMNNKKGGIYYNTAVDSTVISNNTISDNKEYGIFLFCSYDNRIFNNTISNTNGNGICIWGSYLNDVFENRLINNKCGVLCFDISWYTNIHNNEFKLNTVGLIIDNCPKSNITKNNFIDNEVHAIFGIFLLYLLLVKGQMFKWYNNYWDDINNRKIKIIKGEIGFFLSGITYPWYNFDWNPVSEPYDI